MGTEDRVLLRSPENRAYPPDQKEIQALQGQVVVNGTAVSPSPVAKLLGVSFDQEMRWKEHVQQVIKHATKVTVALGGLRHLRPEQMRQLYQSCVTPVVDYASTVWHDPLRDKFHLRHLNTVERTSLLRILSAFRTVATTTLEAEAHILSTHLRLRHRAQRTIANLHTLPREHPIWDTLSRAQRRRNNIGQTIDPRPLPPWRLDPFVEIEVGSDRETAIEQAMAIRSISDIIVYSDASGCDGQLGAAVVAFNDNMDIVDCQQIQVGPMDSWSVHVAELVGIFHAFGTVFKLAHQIVRPQGRQVTATILCDSRLALQAIKSVRNRSGQRIAHTIHQAASEAQTSYIALRLQWVPGHCDNPGNDAADRMAKHAASPGKSHSFCPLLTREKAFIHGKIAARWEQEWRTPSKGGHLWEIDDTLSATHTRSRYQTSSLSSI
ncbi:hypothetical protein N7541_009473, partial [Penicillium brevicompactum]